MTSSPAPGTGTARAWSATVVGVDGHIVEVVAESSAGPPHLRILGLPEAVTRETRDRVRAAVINAGLPWPAHSVTVSLLPASLPRPGTSFDLAIAVAVLAAAGVVPADAPDRCVFLAELGLDGTLRPVPGVLPALLAAARSGCTRAVVSSHNGAEAGLAPDMAAVPCGSLREVHAWLRGDPVPGQPNGPAAEAALPAAPVPPVTGLDSLAVGPEARLAAEVSAAGGHHLCLAGPRSAGIRALAAAVAGLLPPLSTPEALEVAAVWSVAGLLGPGHALVTRPPFRAPHHTATAVALAGGGPGITRPGEAALAHRGVLFLDQAPEFARDALTVLRQPLSQGAVTITRAGQTARFPAKFILVAGLPPCPCGGRDRCPCTPVQGRRYRARLTGDLGSHFSIWADVARVVTDATDGGRHGGSSGDGSAARVAEARDRARHRLRGTPWQLNSDIPGAELRRSFRPDAGALAPVSRAVDLGEISVRAAGQVVRVAWTLADLAGAARPGVLECGQALAFQLGVTR